MVVRLAKRNSRFVVIAFICIMHLIVISDTVNADLLDDINVPDLNQKSGPPEGGIEKLIHYIVSTILGLSGTEAAVSIEIE